jgi:hypothetical protein
MGFVAFLLLAFSGAFIGLYATSVSPNPWLQAEQERKLFTLYLGVMAGLAWLAVFAGTYVIYPWYRAAPPPGAGLAGLSAAPADVQPGDFGVARHRHGSGRSISPGSPRSA